MSAYLWLVPFLGLTALIVFLFVALQRWTAGKQQQMSAEFRIWFQENYLGVKADSTPQPHPGDGGARTRKASATTRGDKPAS